MLAYNIEIADGQIKNTSNREHQNRGSLNKHAIQTINRSVLQTTFKL